MKERLSIGYALSRVELDIDSRQVIHLNRALKAMHKELQDRLPHTPIPSIEFNKFLDDSTTINIRMDMAIENYNKQF